MSKKSDEINWFKTWFNNLYPKLYPHRNLKEAELQISSLVNLIQIKESCLDIACGTGRHIRYLSELYKNVHGIDLSNDLIQIGIENDNFLKANVQLADMRQPPFEANSFDLITNFFTGFGYFQTDNEHQDLLNTWSKLLKKDGVLLIDYLNKDYVISNIVAETNKIIDIYKVTELRSINNNRIEKRIIIQSEQETKTYIESVRMYSLGEMEKFLKNSGFKIIKPYGDFYWQPFTNKSSRLIIACSNVESNFKI